jgi:sugar phosphate permease
MQNKTLVNQQEWQRQAMKVQRLGWRVWGVAIIAQLFNQFHRVAGSAAVDRIMADFGITATAVGGIMGMYFYVYAAMQFPSGVLADYVGPRKIVTYGCLVASIGSIIFGLAPSFLTLYLGRFLVSLGVSVIYVNVLKIQTQWFQSRHFARMTSLTAFASNAGTLIGTTPMALLIILVGWRLPFELMGFVTLAVCLACWLVIRNKAADLGLPSPAEIERGMFASTVSTHAPEVATVGFGKRLNSVLTNRYIWPPFLIGIGLYGTLLVIQGAWGIPYLMQVYSMTRDSAADLMLLIVFGAMVGLITIPVISDKLQRRKLPAIVCAFAYLCLWLMLTLWDEGKPPLSALYSIYFLLGYFTGYTPVSFACAKEVVPPLVSGMAMGLVNMSIFLSAAILQILVGKVLDLGWQGTIVQGARVYPLVAFQSGFLIVCIAVLGCVIGALLLRETQCRDIYSEI